MMTGKMTGAQAMSEHPDTKHTDREQPDRDSLVAKRAQLSERLAAIRKDLGRGLDRDSSEQAIELENAEVLAEIARVTQEQIDRIDEQLSQHV
jgi:hypothetical protein